MPDNDEVLKLSIEAEDKASSVLRKAKDEVRKLKEEMNKTAEAVTKAQEKVNSAELNLANALPKQRGAFTRIRNEALRNLNTQKKAQDLYRQDLRAQYAERSSLIEDKLVRASYNASKGVLSATVRKDIDDHIRERTYLYNENTGSLELQKESVKENSALVRAREREQVLRAKEQAKLEAQRAKEQTLREEQNRKAFANMPMAQPNSPYYQNIYDSLFTKKGQQPNVLPNLKQQKTVMSGLGEEVHKLGKEIKNYKPGKLLKSFGRIATYRAIRTILAGIVNSLKEGVELVSNSNPILKETMTEISAASTGFKVALGNILVPILSQLSPLLTNLSSGLISVSNAMSLNNKATHKNGQYFRINAEKVREYSESLNAVNGALTELDKFATLSQSKPILGEWVDVDSEEALQDIADATKFKGLKDTLTVIKVLVEDVLNSFTNLNNYGIEAIVGVAGAIGMMVSPLKTVLALVGAVFAVWSTDAPIAGKVMTAVLATVATAAYILYTTAEGVQKGTYGLIAALAAGGTLVAAAASLKSNLTSLSNDLNVGSSSLSNINFYKEGGRPSAGEIFIANEAGAEMIGTIGGRTAVVNNDDIVNSVSAGVYGAMSRAMSENRNDNVVNGDVYLDSTRVGQVVAKGVYTEGIKAGFWGKK